VFDFRYHVASLAAVFLALVIGILVGVGISGRGLVDKSERKILQNQIAQLQSDLDSAKASSAQLEQQQEATKTLVQDAYPALMAGRLAGKKIALVVVGSDGGAAASNVDKAVADAGAGEVVRYRALKVPVDVASLGGVLAKHKQLASYVGDAKLGDLGRELGRELVLGGKSPAWDALAGQLVEERHGVSAAPVDAAVVIRAVGPQNGPTGRFLVGLYKGLADAGVPAVGVEVSDTTPSAEPAFRTSGLSSVDDVDTPLGHLALALLLAGGSPGDYGVGAKTAPDGLLPPVVPLPPATATTGG